MDAFLEPINDGGYNEYDPILSLGSEPLLSSLNNDFN